MAITANTDTLLRQAPMTATTYLLEAVNEINKILGEGYAEKHPELVAAFIQTCAIDFHTCLTVKAIEEASESITYELSQVAKALGDR